MRRLIRIGLKEIDSVGRRPKLIQNGLKGLRESRADRGSCREWVGNVTETAGGCRIGVGLWRCW